MSLTRDQTLGYALKFRGVAESPPYSNDVLFSRWYGLRGPWCAMFVSYILYHTGHAWPIRTSKGFAYVPDGVDAARREGRFHDARWTGAEAMDLIFYSFGGVRPDHVGFVIGRLPDGRWHTLEGNTGSDNRDGGSVQERYRRTGIIGFAHRDYPRATTTPSTEEFTVDAEAKARFDRIDAEVGELKAWAMRHEAAFEDARDKWWTNAARRTRLLLDHFKIPDQ